MPNKHNDEYDDSHWDGHQDSPYQDSHIDHHSDAPAHSDTPHTDHHVDHPHIDGHADGHSDSPHHDATPVDGKVPARSGGTSDPISKLLQLVERLESDLRARDQRLMDLEHRVAALEKR
jgi:hypothetical protein